MSEVKTRQTFEQWYDSEGWKDTSATREELYSPWNAALANVIMPETMCGEDVKDRVWVAIQSVYGNGDGRAVRSNWINVIDAILMALAGKILVQELVPSAGGVTFLDDDEAFADKLGEAGWLCTYDAQWRGLEKLRQEILADRAATIATTDARVRTEYETGGQMQAEIIAIQAQKIVKLESDIVDLRAQLTESQIEVEELVTLAAKQTGIEIPEWPGDAIRLVWQWVYSSGTVGPLNSIDRPQPQKLTHQEQWRAIYDLLITMEDTDPTDEQKAQIEAMCEAAGIPTVRGE